MSGRGIMECDCGTCGHAVHSSEHTDIASEIVYHVPDPWFPVKSICPFPYRFYLSREIEQDHVLVGYCIKQGFYLGRFPKFPIAVKQPSLHDPASFGICLQP